MIIAQAVLAWLNVGLCYVFTSYHTLCHWATQRYEDVRGGDDLRYEKDWLSGIDIDMYIVLGVSFQICPTLVGMCIEQ